MAIGTVAEGVALACAASIIGNLGCSEVALAVSQGTNLVSVSAGSTLAYPSCSSGSDNCATDVIATTADHVFGGGAIVGTRKIVTVGARRGVSRPPLPIYAPGSLSMVETRRFYHQGEDAIADLVSDMRIQGASSEEVGRAAFETRNALRTHSRSLMSNRQAAEALNRNEPNMTWEQAVRKYESRGLRGEAVFDAIAGGASRSRLSVDRKLGLTR
jgi:hypothetical protein